jgi:cytochrome c oxidase assembly protein subunit 15
MLKDEIGIFHACLAQAFFGLLVFIALVTSHAWAVVPGTANRDPILIRIAIITTTIIYMQLALGATMRHQHRDLSITDFPTAYGQWLPETNPAALAKINAARDALGLSRVTAGQIWLQLIHRFGALLVAIGVIAFCTGAHYQRKRMMLRKLAVAWLCGVVIQIALGGWVIWSNKAADVATAHVAVGAIMFGLGITISALSWRWKHEQLERRARRPEPAAVV